MSDQAEKVVLEAEDQVTPVVGQANASLDSFEKKAESSHTKVIRISDQTRSSIQRLIASLEKQAEIYGKSGVDKLIAQRDQLLQRYAKEPAAIDAITRSYEKMIETQKKLDAEAKFAGFADKIKQGITNPLEGAKGVLNTVLTSMGPWGVAMAGGAAVLGTFAVAGFEAAKSLGEYGVRIRDAELRTGLTAKQVGQFSFAARAAGQDVTIFERMMKGLSAAADDTSKEGEKARATLQRLGVTMVDAHTGALKPTAEVMEQIAEGLNRLPAGFERDAAAIALFKRAGLEAVPVIAELGENLKIARAAGYGASEDDVNRMMRYQREVTQAEMAWERLARSVKEPLAATVIFTAKFVGAAWGFAKLPFDVLGQTMFGGKLSPDDLEMQETGGWGYGASMSLKYHREEQAAIQRNDQVVAAAKASQEDRLSTAEKKLADLQGELKTGVLPEVNEPVLKQIEQQRQVIAGIKAQTEASKQLKEWEREAAEFEKKGDEAELDAIGKIYYQRDQLLKQGAKVNAQEQELAAIRKSADEQVDKIYTKARTEFEAYEAAREHGPNLRLFGEDQLKEWKAYFDTQERIEDIAVQAQKGELTRQANRAGRMAELGGGTDEEVAQQTYKVRVDLAYQLAQIEADRIAKEDDANKKAVMAAQALKDLYTGLQEAEDQYQEKQLEIQQRRQQQLEQERESQKEMLQRTSAGLLNTLFTKPSEFPKQLGSNIREATLRPVTEGLSGMAANAMYPLVYGNEGQGGIAGILHGVFGAGKQDPVTVTADNTTATVQNSRALWLLTAVLSEFMGRNVSALSTQGSGTVPNIGIASPSGFLSQALRNTGGLPRFAQGGITNGATIVGESGPELVVPLPDLLKLYPGGPVPVRGGYAPGTDEALLKTFSSLAGIALPAGLSALGGPAGLGVGDTLKSLIIGTSAAVERPPDPRVLQGVMLVGGSGDARLVKPEEIPVNPEKINFLFNKNEESIRAVGRKGGLAAQRARRLREMEEAEERELSDAMYRGPEPGPVETTHQAVGTLDEMFPHLRGAFDKSAIDRLRQANAAIGGRLGGGANRAELIHVMVGGESMTLEEAAAQIHVSRRALYSYLYKHVPREQWGTVDVGSVQFSRSLPSYDSGGTVASTGLAVVHEGEAVVPQADSLKRSIDKLVNAMDGNTGILRWLLQMPGITRSGSNGGVPISASTSDVPFSWWRDTEGNWSDQNGSYSTRAVDQSGLPIASTNIAGSFPAVGTVSRTGGGFNFNLGSLKGTFNKADWWNNDIYTGSGTATTAAGIGGIRGDMAAVLSSKGAGQLYTSVGLPLTLAGLTGSRRGTWGGITEDTAGGALTGAGIGTMIMPGIGTAIGAGIGAAAGFVAGGLEKLVGIESDAQKAHDDIKSIYGVDIPTNSGTIKQIVQIAQSQFGDNVAVAVRSPAVRQIVMLYSEATGQHMPLSATTPYAGSLVEQGGKLYQQASFQNNAWHTYTSSLPTLGGLPATSYPTPGLPYTAGGTGINLALNINGTPITPQFVADSSMAAQDSSYGRTQQAANLQVPGLMVS